MRAYRPFVWITLLGLVAAAPSASAQSFSIEKYGEGNQDDITATEWPDYLNTSRCLCDEARGTTEDAFLWLQIRYSGSETSGSVFFYVGDNCDDTAVVIDDRCYLVAQRTISDFQTNEQDIAVPVNRIVDPTGGTCDEQDGGASYLYIIVGDKDNSADTTLELPYDTMPQGTPINVEASAGENAVEVSWDPPSTNDDDIEYYNILCAIDGTPVSGLASESNADWISTEELCDKELAIGDATDVPAAPDCSNITSGIIAGETPSPCYVCDSVTSSTSVRISGLENGVTYQFAVVTVDSRGNVSPVSTVVTATPEVTTDFAEHYRDSGGQEDGGFCFVATAVYGSYRHPDVIQLRAFRDDILARSVPGRRFIDWYYRNGSALAAMTQLFPKLGPCAWFGLKGLTWISSQVAPAAPAQDSGQSGLARGLPAGLLLLGLVASLGRLSRRREDEDQEVSQ